MKETEIDVLKRIDNKLETLNNPPLWRSFLQGLLTGFGTVVGATILIALMISLLQNFITIPVIGDFVREIIEVVENK
jgi:hypothetical protein